MRPENNIQIISAPSILGLKPNGVEELAENLLRAGLVESIGSKLPVKKIPTLNHLYNIERDPETKCLNPKPIRNFSLTLGDAVLKAIEENKFSVVLGGDCSILIGIIQALKSKGEYGLIFLDAHADFYEPGKSITGELADMDLAIVTGRGPEILTNINNLKPYVKDENVIHIGQRDWKETQKYNSRDIRETSIKCYSFADIEKKGIDYIIRQALRQISSLIVEKYWIHFDTDVLADEVNPAVDYRLPGGLDPENVKKLIQRLVETGRMVGISITIFNPKLDPDGRISKKITEILERALKTDKLYS
jgi:arginase